MAQNFLEQLLKEWYEFQGYFVLQNIRVGKRAEGGHEMELDIVAYHPIDKKLVHLEPSMDADSWERREERYKKKFDLGKKYIPNLFTGLKIEGEIEQFAVFVIGSKKNHTEIGGGKIMLGADLASQIYEKISPMDILNNAVPEKWPLLRTFQFMAKYKPWETP
ncbi:MAG: hypothetical protein OEV94_09690 [Deltaproteobacteria bacterium]|nr:hypothetical protein [Deltaproteobacteria bacterium]